MGFIFRNICSGTYTLFDAEENEEGNAIMTLPLNCVMEMYYPTL